MKYVFMNLFLLHLWFGDLKDFFFKKNNKYEIGKYNGINVIWNWTDYTNYGWLVLWLLNILWFMLKKYKTDTWTICYHTY